MKKGFTIFVIGLLFLGLVYFFTGCFGTAPPTPIPTPTPTPIPKIARMEINPSHTYAYQGSKVEFTIKLYDELGKPAEGEVEFVPIRDTNIDNLIKEKRFYVGKEGEKVILTVPSVYYIPSNFELTFRLVSDPSILAKFFLTIVGPTPTPTPTPTTPTPTATPTPTPTTPLIVYGNAIDISREIDQCFDEYKNGNEDDLWWTCSTGDQRAASCKKRIRIRLNPILQIIDGNTIWPTTAVACLKNYHSSDQDFPSEFPPQAVKNAYHFTSTNPELYVTPGANGSFDCITSTFASGYSPSPIMITFDGKNYPDVWGYYVEATYYWNNNGSTISETYTSNATFGIDTKGPILVGAKADYYHDGVSHDSLYYTLFDMGIGVINNSLGDGTYSITDTITDAPNPQDIFNIGILLSITSSPPPLDWWEWGKIYNLMPYDGYAGSDPVTEFSTGTSESFPSADWLGGIITYTQQLPISSVIGDSSYLTDTFGTDTCGTKFDEFSAGTYITDYFGNRAIPLEYSVGGYPEGAFPFEVSNK